MLYFLLFRANSEYANGSQYYVTRTLPHLLPYQFIRHLQSCLFVCLLVAPEYKNVFHNLLVQE
jgi:hypothetical protein